MGAGDEFAIEEVIVNKGKSMDLRLDQNHWQGGIVVISLLYDKYHSAIEQIWVKIQ